MRGVERHTLDHYRVRYRTRRAATASQDLLPVDLISTPSESSGLHVELANGRRIVVEAGFDASLLRRLARFWKAEAVFALGAATRVYVATGVTDMRIGFDGLYGKNRDSLECDPTSGLIFLSSDERRNSLKLVSFDGFRLWVCSKRMKGGRLDWPVSTGNEKRLQLSREHFVRAL